MPVYLFEHIVRHQPLSRLVVRIPPAEELQYLIDSFIIAPLEHGLAFNDGCPTIIFRAQDAWLSGPYFENIYLSHYDEPVLIVRFNPVMFCRLFDINAIELRHQAIWELPAILGNNGFLLLSEVMQAGSVNDKIRKIEAFVLQLSKDHHYSNALLEQALSAIQQAKGNIAVLQLASTLKVNYKWLERNFTKHIGITPKEYIRLQRFIHTYFDFISNKEPEIMQVALDNGYCDNNHFTKDFKRFTGKAPLAYLQSMTPI